MSAVSAPLPRHRPAVLSEMIVRDGLPNGICLLTEAIPHVRSVSLGVWLTCGSRHEDHDHEGIAHLAEHMLFKGTTSRSAQDIAQEVDSIGGQLDAFTAKEYGSYYVKVLDDHLHRAVDLLADLVLRPAFDLDDLEREKKVILEEIKMVEDIPDDLVHESFTESYWPSHPLGRSILGTPESVTGISQDALRDFFRRSYVGGHLVIAAAGSLDHAQVRDLVGSAFESATPDFGRLDVTPPTPSPTLVVKDKDLEQTHLCLGTPCYPQGHEDRFASYVLNTLLGGSMSSRLFQHIREERGLAYAVSSSLISYHDAGALTVYAGCDTAAAPEVIALVAAELRNVKHHAVPAVELQRAKDHLKGNLVLSLESTTSRMSQLARSEMSFGRQIALSENLSKIDEVSAEDVQRVATECFAEGALAATVLGPVNGIKFSKGQLAL